MEPQVWHTLVVRLWRDGDGLKVRFLASRTGQQPSHPALATSAEAATRQFEQWLRSTSPEGGPDVGTGPRAAYDANGTTRETQRRRWGDGVADSPLLASPGVEDDATRDEIRREPS